MAFAFGSFNWLAMRKTFTSALASCSSLAWACLEHGPDTRKREGQNDRVGGADDGNHGAGKVV